jgi:DNA processing protein
LNNINNLKYLFLLSKINNLGNVRIRNILNKFPYDKSIFEASINEIKFIEGINDNVAKDILDFSKNKNKYSEEYKRMLDLCDKKKIKIITILDEQYPVNLKNIYDAPVILYYKGKLFKEDAYSLSIVGTRYPSEYGKNACQKFVNELSELKIPVISGMARGIDALSHKVCLDNGNITYAVLGSGVDVIYPPDNKNIYDMISENGAVISEFEIGAKPDKVNFPRRNRIISGISLGTLIIETGLRGGSRITAEFALDQNKEIFAVPGYIYSKKSEGCNNMIKKGMAKLVENADDIISELCYKLDGYADIGKKAYKEEKQTEMSLFERGIYDVLEYMPKHIDEISFLSAFNISDCLVSLLSLEFKGLIRQMPGKYFIKI